MIIPPVPRPEYPRPQLAREQSWMNLNGTWEFEIDAGRSGKDRGLHHADRGLKGRIVVPFAPESPLSGVGHTDFMPAVWYRRKVQIPAHWSGMRLLLHVGASDYATTVYVDGVEVGRHVGGYTPFSFDITHLVKHAEAIVTICAEDDVRGFAQAKGKQSHLYDSFGCDYTRTTGIWQTVWLEAVPRTYLQHARITPQLEAEGAMVELRLAGDRPPTGSVLRLQARAGDDVVGEVRVPATAHAAAFIPVSVTRPWSPDDPFLYDLTIHLEEAGGRTLDQVESYFGLRSVVVDGHAVLLNGRPVFQRLVLDQGFYPDGIYTAPSDAALRRDVELGLQLGFNGARLHQKVFEPRFLYWCDRLGYLVWGEGPDWGLDVDKADGLAGFVQTFTEMVERDYSHPSLVGWCPFNEHTYPDNPEACRALYRLTKALDATRPVIDASGWQHVETDIYDVHDYDQNPATFAKRYEPLRTGVGKLYENSGVAPGNASYRPGQPYFVSEFGGIWWNPGQVGTEAWGYGAHPQSEEEFLTRFEGLCAALLEHPNMFGFCYTQLTDVEQEVNGLYTYDRRPKFDPERIRRILARPAAIEAPHAQQPLLRDEAIPA